MTSPLVAFLIKLPLALLVFLLIAYAGTVSKRVAGVLFTFPILNGIAIIASPDPVMVADAIYPLVIFNCVLFAALISFPRTLPPVGALPRWGRLFARVIVWTLAWLAGALVLTHHRSAIPGGGTLLAGAAVFAIAFMALAWSRGAPADTPSPTIMSTLRRVLVHRRRLLAHRVLRHHLCVPVLRRARGRDQKWVGMASALPLPGFFALAVLIDDVEDKSAAMAALTPIRDTLFLGPLLVIPFNWTFSHALLSVLPPDGAVLRYLSSSRCGPWPRPPWCCWSRASPRGSTAARLEPAHALQSGMSAPSNTAHQTASRAKPRPICCSTSTIRSTGGRGARALAEAQRATSRSCSRSATRVPLVPRDGARELRGRATARVMNELFVNIKVDREERPDIDQIYMNALHLLGEQGRLAAHDVPHPAGEPVWGGTYFPERPRASAAPAFVDVLSEVAPAVPRRAGTAS
jgi:hypothetical protein